MEAAPVIEPLASRHDRAAFSCGVDALDQYLRRQAGQDAKRHAAATFVLTFEGSTTVAGFYTLSAASIELLALPEATAKRLPKYPQLPAILLGRLAVDGRWAGQGFGGLLLADALKRCLTISDLGWVAVVVDAKDDSALAFYLRHHFVRLSASSMRLMLSRETIRKLFEG